MIPFAGLLIDRLNRPNLITISNSWLFKITFSLRVLTIFGWISVFHLFVFALMSGIVQTVNQTLRQVLVFDLVPRSLTPNAAAVVQTGWSLMRIIEPSLGWIPSFIFWCRRQLPFPGISVYACCLYKPAYSISCKKNAIRREYPSERYR